MRQITIKIAFIIYLCANSNLFSFKNGKSNLITNWINLKISNDVCKGDGDADVSTVCTFYGNDHYYKKTSFYIDYPLWPNISSFW